MCSLPLPHPYITLCPSRQFLLLTSVYSSRYFMCMYANRNVYPLLPHFIFPQRGANSTLFCTFFPSGSFELIPRRNVKWLPVLFLGCIVFLRVALPCALSQSPMNRRPGGFLL